MPMPVLMTGGASFIGSHLVDLLLRNEGGWPQRDRLEEKVAEDRVDCATPELEARGLVA